MEQYPKSLLKALSVGQYQENVKLIEKLFMVGGRTDPVIHAIRVTILDQIMLRDEVNRVRSYNASMNTKHYDLENQIGG